MCCTADLVLTIVLSAFFHRSRARLSCFCAARVAIDTAARWLIGTVSPALERIVWRQALGPVEPWVAPLQELFPTGDDWLTQVYLASQPFLVTQTLREILIEQLGIVYEIDELLADVDSECARLLFADRKTDTRYRGASMLSSK